MGAVEEPGARSAQCRAANPDICANPLLEKMNRSPVQVLVISLVFIAFVVLMHIYGKVRGSSIKEEE